MLNSQNSYGRTCIVALRSVEFLQRTKIENILFLQEKSDSTFTSALFQSVCVSFSYSHIYIANIWSNFQNFWFSDERWTMRRNMLGFIYRINEWDFFLIHLIICILSTNGFSLATHTLIKIPGIHCVCACAFVNKKSACSIIIFSANKWRTANDGIGKMYSTIYSESHLYGIIQKPQKIWLQPVFLSLNAFVFCV